MLGVVLTHFPEISWLTSDARDQQRTPSTHFSEGKRPRQDVGPRTHVRACARSYLCQTCAFFPNKNALVYGAGGKPRLKTRKPAAGAPNAGNKAREIRSNTEWARSP